MTVRTHCVAVTSSRADYSFLRWVFRAIGREPSLRLSIVASGSHTSARHGATAFEIEADGFEIAERLSVFDDDDSDLGVARNFARASNSCAECFARLEPDLVILLGDRYEILAAAVAATLLRVPIAHLCGGDVSEGAYDEGFRHAITKLASLHFPTNAVSAARLERMGEPPERVVVAGSPSLDALHEIAWLERDAVFRELDLPVSPRLLVTTYHPTTRNPGHAGLEIAALLDALSRQDPTTAIVFTGVNADSEGHVIREAIKAFCAERPNAVARESLGQTLYLNVVRQAVAVVGNSSSGLYEAPALGVPTLNIGDRQKGRLRAASVIDAPADADAIAGGLDTAMAWGRRTPQTPYGDGRSGPRIASALAKVDDFRALLKKPFWEGGSK